jgi:beta-phosphoglucomutase-like phosphatase (HAD superfamily)
VDLEQCKELVAKAEAYREDGSPAAAREAVQGALDLWYGDPLDGVPGPAAQATRTRLRALRLTLCATRAELDLESGRFERAATDLGELLRSHPEREDFRRLHILALKAQGRTAEAVESYETYEALQDRQFNEPDPTLLQLYRELRAVPDDNRPAITMECTDPGDHRGAHSTLSHTLTWLLSLGGLTSDQYDMNAVDDGYLVFTAPGTSVLGVLNATLRDLPDILLETPDPPRVRLTFWHTARPPRVPLPAALERSDIAVVLSPVLYEELTAGDLPAGPAGFRPLHTGPGDGPPLAWYRRLEIPDRVPAPEPGSVPRDLVRGPFSTRRAGSIRLPEPGRTAVVVQPSDGPPALFDPEAFAGTPASGSRITYHEVDLTTHRASHELSLPASRGGTFTASAELSWHVDDPVEFVRGGTTGVSARLLDHLLREARRVTRRHPLQRAGAAQHAVHDVLRDGAPGWPVPGLSVACSVRLTPGAEPQPVRLTDHAPTAQHDLQPALLSRQTARIRRTTTPSPDGSATFLVRAPCVLIGFDGPLVRLYTGDAERQATRELTALLAELRNPQDALSGEPLTAQAAAEGAPAPPLEGRVNPLDLLRAFAGHPLGGDLRRRLNRIEERAVSAAAATPFSDALITTLDSLGRRTAVVADNAPSAVWKYLQAHGRLTGLVTGGVHGRANDLTRLMPDPDCLLRALEHLGATPKDAVMVGSSVAELTAAKALGLRFLGYTRSEPHRQRLVRAGCELTTASWAPLLQALPNT